MLLIVLKKNGYLNGKKQILKTKKRLNEIYQKHTNISIGEIEKAMERDRFFDPEEALKFGLIDKVISNREEK